MKLSHSVKYFVVCLLSFVVSLYTIRYSDFCIIYLFIVLILLSCICSGITSEWSGYPIDSFFDNIGDGWSCFIGSNPSDYTRYDSSYASCEYSYLLVLGYVISNVVVLECIDRVLQTSNQILGRAMAAAVFVAFLALGIYDTNRNFGNELDGNGVDLYDIIAIIVLLAGMEIYGRDPEPESEQITNFVP